MSYVEKQRHGNHDYFYLVKSIRVSPTSVKKIKIFLGRQMPAHSELQKRFAELEKKVPGSFSPKQLSTELAEKIDDLRSSVITFKNFPDDALPKDFLVRFTYNTNAIEGNPLTLRETALILVDGIAPQGAKTNDIVEVSNGKDAWEFVKTYKNGLNEDFVCKTQFEITKNTTCRLQGKYRDSEVGISGSDWKPPAAKEVPKEIETALQEFKQLKKQLHPVELASWIHNKTVQVHPFTDGNGRTARLLMNWVLIKHKLPPVIIEAKNKQEYYNTIEAADKGDEKPFVEFLAKQLLQQYTIKETKNEKTAKENLLEPR
ncbi:MAG: Fic family protein [Candidatus Micrarchaeota archaeon]